MRACVQTCTLPKLKSWRPHFSQKKLRNSMRLCAEPEVRRVRGVAVAGDLLVCVALWIYVNRDEIIGAGGVRHDGRQVQNLLLLALLSLLRPKPILPGVGPAYRRPSRAAQGLQVKVPHVRSPLPRFV